MPEDKYEDGSYSDNKTMIVQLSSGESIEVPNTLKNLNIGVQSYIIILVLILSIVLFIILRKKKYIKFMILIIATAIIIPISAYALCTVKIKATSNITIIEPEKTSVIGSIVWDDSDNKDNIRPGFVVVNLLANGEVIVSKQVTADDN